MMRIQASTRYALRILQYLYGKGNRTVKAGELSGQLGLSSLYTAKVLGKLKESKVVRSEQGCYGGYRMASPAEKVSVYEVFIAMEGDFVLYEPKADGPEDGAEQTIRRCRPKLNIAAYHRSEDFFELPLRIHELNPDYRLYLRHHPYVPAWDTNLYAI